jgi:hypothetical protein
MTPSGEQEFRPRDEPAEGATPPPGPPPLALRQTESNLDWLENQKRSRQSKFLLDFAILAITLCACAVLGWAVVALWRR